MAISTKRYITYDLSQERNVRTDSQNDEVAFKSIAVGGISGPALSEAGGDFDVNGAMVHNLGYPTQNDDAATKAYVDNVAQGLTVKSSVVTTTLPADFATAAVNEITNVSVPAGSSIAPGSYWYYYHNGWAGSPAEKVIVWYKVDGSGSAPTDIRYDQAIQVNIASTDDAETVGFSTIPPIVNAGYGATASLGGNPFRLTILSNGDVLPAADGNVGGMTFNITTKGTGFWQYGNGNTAITSLGVNPIATTVSSQNVVVSSNAHGLYVGDKVEINGATALNGLSEANLDGEKTITAVTANTFTFDAGAAATATGSGGGSSVTTMYRSLMTLRGLISGPKFDGYTLVANDRLLIKDMPTAKRPFNGIFYVYSVPSATSLIVSRTADADNQPNGGEVSGGMFTFVDNGLTYADSGWVMSSPHGPATLGTDNLIFVQFSAAGVIQAGNGLEKVGNILNVRPGDGIKIDISNNVAVNLTGVTLTVNSSGLKVSAGGITETELNSSVAGNGLTGGGGSALAVGAGSGITVGSDSVSLSSSVAGDGLTYTTGVLDIVGTDGISVASDSISLASTVAGNGLTYTSGVLDVVGVDGISVASDSVSLASTVAGDGLTYTSGVLDVVGVDGISVTSDNISLASSVAGNGLTYTSGVLDVVAGDGLTAASNSIYLSSSVAGDGLSYTSGILAINAGKGLSLNSDNLDINAGDGLTIVSDIVNVLAEDPTISVSSAGIKLGTPTSGSPLQFLQTDGSGNVNWATVDLASVDLQASYDNSSTPATITTVSGKQIIIAGAESLSVTADGGLVVTNDIQSADGRFKWDSVKDVLKVTDAFGNTGIGDLALQSAASGSFACVAVGYKALQNDTTGTTNTAIGSEALASVVTGYANTAVGYQTLKSNTAYSNIGIGNLALTANTTGYQNIALGPLALGNNVSGNRNIAIGLNAMQFNSSLSNNIVIGHSSGIGSYSGVIVIGNSRIATADSQLMIGPYKLSMAALGSNGQALKTDGSGNLAWGSYAFDDLTDVTLTSSASGQLIQFNGSQWVNASLAAGDGLTYDGTTFALASTTAGNGLTYTSGVLDVVAGNGLTTTSDSIYLSSSVAGDGLTYTSGVLDVVAGNGLTVASDSIYLSSSVAGDGLTYTSGVLDVVAGNGLTTTSDSIYLSSSVAGDGLTYTSGVLDIELDTYNYTTKVDLSGPASGMLAVRYDEPMVNDEGIFVSDGLAVYMNDTGKVSLCNASDTFLGDGTTFGLTLTAASAGSSLDVYTRPGVLVHGTQTSGILTAGFRIDALALGTNPVTSVLSDSVVIITTPAAHGLVNGDTVTLANLTAFSGLTTGGLNGDKTITVTGTLTFTFDSGDAATASVNGGGSSGTWQRHKLVLNKPVYLSKTDGYLTQDLSSYVNGDSVARIGYAKSALILQFAPMYEIYL